MARPFARGKALYDFAGNEQLRQLTFKAGDLINITNQYDNGWWAGELNGKVGYLPSTYVEIVQNIGGTPSVVPTARAATLSAAAKPAPTPGSAAQPHSSAAAAAPAPAGTVRTPPSAGGAVSPASNSNHATARVPPATPPKPAPTPGAPAFSPTARPTNPPAKSIPPTPTQAPPTLASRPGPTPPAKPPPATPPPKPAPTAATLTKPTPPATKPTHPVSKPPARRATEVAEGDIAELDSLVSKLQADVLELKRLM